MEGDTTAQITTRPNTPMDRVRCFYCQYDITDVGESTAAVRRCPECGSEEPTLLRRLATYRTTAFGLTLLAWALPAYVLCRRLGTFGIVDGAMSSVGGGTSSTQGFRFAPEFRVQIIAASMLLVAAGVGVLAAAQPAARLVRRVTIILLTIVAASLLLRLVPMYDQGNDRFAGISDWVNPRAWDYYSFMLQRVCVAVLAGLLCWNLAEVAIAIDKRRYRAILVVFGVFAAVGYVPWVLSVEAMARSIRIAANAPAPIVMNAPLLNTPGTPTNPATARSVIATPQAPTGGPYWNEAAARMVERTEPLMVFASVTFLWCFVLMFRVHAKVKAEEVVAMAKPALVPPTR